MSTPHRQGLAIGSENLMVGSDHDFAYPFPTLVEVEPGRWRVYRTIQKPARSDLPMPHVISDEMPAVEQVDGKFYTSKRSFRAVGKANGLTEVGNDPGRFKKKWRSTDLPEVKRARKDAVGKAIAEYKQGRRPRAE
jgi:hypothetical protein